MTGQDFYTWQVPSFRVRIAIELIDRINADLRRVREHQEEEQGGLLLGRALHSNLLEITGFEPVRSEHHRGIAYDLGARERDRLTRYIQRLRRRRSGTKPIGFFRTHHRPGLFLDQDDFALMSEAFRDPSCVALLMRPEPAGPASAGFFFWENGDIDRKQTQLAFPFDADVLQPDRPKKTVPLPRKRRIVPIPAWQALLAAAAAAVAGFGIVSATASKPLPVARSQVAVTLESGPSPAGGRFQPARPSASLQPAVPKPLLERLSGELPVDLKVSIDRNGVVRRTEVMSGSGTRLASLAADNLFYTPWRPARLGSEPVDSELILHYRFSPASAERR